MKYLLSSIAVIVFAFSAHAQLDFTNTYTTGGDDYAQAVCNTYDNGYIIAGASSGLGHGATDAYLFKIDSVGNCVWSRNYGTNNIEWANSIVETPDSGYAVLGYTNGIGNGGYDMYLLRLDSLGNLLWAKTFGGAAWEFGHSITLAADSGFVLAGETASQGAGNVDAWVIKTDPQGNIEWDFTYGGGLNDRIFDLDTLSGGGYIAVGESQSFTGNGHYDLWILNLDANGAINWSQSRGDDLDDSGHGIHETVGGDLVIVGTHSEPDTTTQMWLMKITTGGMDVWEDIFGGADNEYGRDVVQQEWPGQALIVLGQTRSFGGGAGDFFYNRRGDNGVYITGNTYGSGFNEEPQAVIRTHDLGYIFVGSTKGFYAQYSDIYVVKMNQAQSVGVETTNVLCPAPTVSIEDELDPTNFDVQVYPNPMQSTATVEVQFPNNVSAQDLNFKIYDMTGREVYSLSPTPQDMGLSSASFTIQPEGLQSGVYLFSIFNMKQQIASGKLLITNP